MQVRLECKGKVLYRAAPRDLQQEVIIGRWSGCAWRLPEDQVWVSARHASLTRRNDEIVVRDLGSRNGIYFRGKRIESKSLQPGDRIVLGQCLLVAEKTPYLRATKGQMGNRSFTVDAFPFVIGSAAGSSLTVPDPVVSREHADIRLGQEGRYLIRDLGSKNGTVVNGKPLKPREDVEITNGARIYVAHYGFVFVSGGLSPMVRYGLVGSVAVGALLLVILFSRGSPRPARPPPVEAPRQTDQRAEPDKSLEALEGLRAWPPAIESALEKLAGAQGGATEDGLHDEQKLIPPLRDLLQSLSQYRKAEGFLTELAIEQARSMHLLLPTAEACSVDPRIDAARRLIEQRFSDLQRCVELLERIPATGGDKATVPSLVLACQDRHAVQQALNCDVLAGAPAEPGRRVPAGEYDRYLGIENAYRFFSVELRGRLQLCPLETPFTTVVGAARTFYGDIETLLKHVEKCGNSDWVRGPLADRLETLRRYLLVRDELINEMLSCSAQGGRRGLIAAAIALQLSPNPAGLKVGNESIGQWALAEFSRTEDVLKGLEEEYETTPARREQIRLEALAQGLPQIPWVERLWRDGSAGQGGGELAKP